MNGDDFDDKPIGGIGEKKTFEQLLEEELRKEQVWKDKLHVMSAALLHSAQTFRNTLCY